ncbi:Fic family protein [Croceibacterium xixiisoli]|uniref:Fic family protein n=1 Tax=Croceibacterium xixiisoli TaxID=1476466 RepID=UPI002E268217
MRTLDQIKADIAGCKAALDGLRALQGHTLDHLQRYYDVELTYTSNAIEGNTLTYRETAELIEHGITVGGKPLRDHLEAVDHYDAVQWMRETAIGGDQVSEGIVCELHRRIVLRSSPDIAGIYSNHARRIAGSPVIFPNPAKIPVLMEQFGQWLAAAPPTPEAAFDAHYRLTAIHPFSDGHGRAARLLMNLMLLRAGYVPVAVRPEDRKSYLDSLEHASLSDGDLEPFQRVMHIRLHDTLRDYVTALSEGIAPEGRHP